MRHSLMKVKKFFFLKKLFTLLAINDLLPSKYKLTWRLTALLNTKYISYLYDRVVKLLMTIKQQSSQKKSSASKVGIIAINV